MGVAAAERLDLRPQLSVITDESPVAERPSNISRIEDYLGEGKREIMTYDADFDTVGYLELQKLKVVNLEEYKRRKKELDNYTRQNLITCLKERFNVILSTTTYDIRDGKVYREGSDEPFLDIIKRGRDYRRKHGSPIDWEREDAEVEGFKGLEELAIGKKRISFSCRGDKGSTYTNNFYDIFERVDKDHIVARRYSSALSLEEYREKIRRINPKYPIPVNLTAAYLLAHQVDVTNPQFSTSDSIHKYLHKDHESMSEERFYQRVLPHSDQYMDEYIENLSKNPDDIQGRNLRYNAILNITDEVEDNNKKGKVTPITVYQNSNKDYMWANIRRYGRRGVRRKKTGCGLSGGLSVSNLQTGVDRVMKSAFSVSEFGMKDKYGSLTFTCPSCNKENTRQMNQLLEACQKCGSKTVSCDTSSNKKTASKKPENIEERRIKKEESKKVVQLPTRVKPVRREQEYPEIKKAA